MGSGSGCMKVEQFDESIQMPSMTPEQLTSTPSSLSPVYIIPPNQPPPNVSVKEEGFKVKSNTDRYTTVWDLDSKLSTSFQQSLKAEFSKADHHQKEIINTKWSKKSSTDIDSTHIESTVNSQTHCCINLSSSEKIDELIRNLNRVHTQLDDSIKRRTHQISTETESVLAHIINETQQEQQRLLYYAKERQTKQDEHYRELLQKYISQLDEMKAKELAQLQEELHYCREQIMDISHMKIVTVNEQANIIKSKIVKEEQQQASMKIDAINLQLHNLPTDESFQQLGTEIMTKTNVITNTNVGTKAIGQNCSFELVQDIPTEDIRFDQHSRQDYTKTTYIDLKHDRHSNREQVEKQTTRKVAVNQKLPAQEYRQVCLSVNSSSLNGKVMFGYQGWFGTNNDGLPGYGYRHWSRDNGLPRPNSLAFDSWPLLDEYPSECLHDTELFYKNGSMARVYSCYCQPIVDLHTKWLAEYNLDGFMLQRFVNEIQTPNPALTQRNQIAQYVRQASEKYSRVFAIMYDISGANPNTLFDTLKNDWQMLVNQMNITSSLQYLHQNGKPVLVIWGIGFTDRPPNSVQDALNIINYFKENAGVYLVGGIPYFWRLQFRDSKPDYLPVYHAFDAISPWSICRYTDHATFNKQYIETEIPDKLDADHHGLSYAPVLFPGYSFANNAPQNMSYFNFVPRYQGQFFTHQFTKILDLKVSWIYLAMFDEINEGTAFYKIASQKIDTPSNANFTYQNIDGGNVSPDAYLKLASELTQKFHEQHQVHA